MFLVPRSSTYCSRPWSSLARLSSYEAALTQPRLVLRKTWLDNHAAGILNSPLPSLANNTQKGVASLTLILSFSVVRYLLADSPSEFLAMLLFLEEYCSWMLLRHHSFPNILAVGVVRRLEAEAVPPNSKRTFET
jgi:hypothetical protein